MIPQMLFSNKRKEYTIPAELQRRLRSLLGDTSVELTAPASFAAKPCEKLPAPKPAESRPAEYQGKHLSRREEPKESCRIEGKGQLAGNGWGAPKAKTQPVGARKAARKRSDSELDDSLYEDFCAAPGHFDETSLDDRIREKDESFQQMLFRLIDEHGMKDSECYKRALIDRRHFSRIRCSTGYQPTKATAVAFAVSLKLSMDETKELLKKAGFALSQSNTFDIIVSYFIEQQQYDIFRINYALEHYDQPLLGTRA